MSVGFGQLNFVGAESYIIINHGWARHFTLNFGRVVKEAFLLNESGKIDLSSNKDLMYGRADSCGIKNIPKLNPTKYPAILKPIWGHKGRGIKIIQTKSDLPEDLSKYVIQQLIKKVAEYRFNFLNNKLVNVSRKLLPEESQNYPGVFDGWLSLGPTPSGISTRTIGFAQKIAACYPELPSIAVDLMKERTTLGAKYWFCEVNTAYGLGPMTAGRLVGEIKRQYEAGELEKFRIK